MTKKEFFIALLLVVCFFGGYLTRKAFEPKYDFKRDTTTYVDTIPYYKPVPKDSMVLRYVKVSLPAKSCDSITTNRTEDSISVDIPISQKYYESEDYKAWVSGYEPSLDSIKVCQKTIEIKETIMKTPNRWNIGVFGGYGYGFSSKRFEPVIGIGIGYRIW